MNTRNGWKEKDGKRNRNKKMINEEKINKTAKNEAHKSLIAKENEVSNDIPLDKMMFVKALAREIVAQMFEASENKSKEKSYIG